MPMIYDPTGEPVEIAAGRGDLRFTSAPFNPFASGGGIDRIGGRTISFADLFATQIWVGTAVMRLLTGAIRVPLKAYQRTGADSRERLRDHPLAAAITDPWDGGSQAQLVMALLGPLLVHGNGLTELEQGARDRIRFDPADWRQAKPIRPFEKRIAGWTLTEDGADRAVGSDTMLHLAWWSPLGPTGVSPLQQLGVTLSIEDAAQRYQQSLFRNGARPPSALTMSDEFLGLKPEERATIVANLREDVTNLHVNPDNAGRPPLLPPGLDWKPIGHSAVEAELIDQRKVAREEVAAIFQIPPPMIGILDKATFSNIETQREMFFTDSLGPPLILIEQALNATLVRGLLREDDLFVEFDFAGVLRGDRLKEMQALREAIDSSLMTPNEGRGVLNMPKSDADGMDDFYYRANNLRAVGDSPDDELDGEPADPAAAATS